MNGVGPGCVPRIEPVPAHASRGDNDPAKAKSRKESQALRQLHHPDLFTRRSDGKEEISRSHDRVWRCRESSGPAITSNSPHKLNLPSTKTKLDVVVRTVLSRHRDSSTRGLDRLD